MKFKPYPKYKDSGIEWLGEVPGHWEVSKLKWLLTESMMYGANESADDETPENPRYVRITDIDSNGSLRNDTFKSLPYEIAKPYILKEGDILLARSGATVGKSFIYLSSWGVCCFAGYLIKAKFNPKLINHKYSFACLQSSFYWNYINSEQIQSTIQNVSAERYANFVIQFPPLDEQAAIINFLDRETHRIDTLIEEKNRFIGLLKEKRQALISHAVTKCLDPTIKMKDSGVDWLGDIPEQWAVKRIKHLFEIRKRIAGKEGFPVLSITQAGIKIKDTESGEGQLSMDYSKYQFVEIGDFAMNHMDLLTGYVDISPFFGVTSPDYRVFVLRDRNSVSRYYLYLMQMGYKDKIFFSYGQGVANVGRWRFQTESFNNFSIPYPSKEEQQRIVDFLDKETSKIDALVQETQTSIELLKEHRSALIGAAVTGKIDVREAA